MKISNLKNNFLSPVRSLSYLSFSKSFEVRKVENLCCPICGSMMFTKQQAREFIKELSSATGADIAKVIDKYEKLNSNSKERNFPVFNSREQEILDRIKSTALEIEDSELCEIADILGREVAEKYSSFSSRNILSKYSSPYPDARPILSDEDYADLFFLNCRNKKLTSHEIARTFIKNKFPTIEHIVPVKDQGKNEFGNYLCDCSECNSKRGSMPFDIWINYIPNVEENLQIQIKQLNTALENSSLSKQYQDYPKQLTDTVSSLSKGKINLVV